MLQALAVMEERQGNRENALALLERALKQDPLDAPSWQVPPLMGTLPSPQSRLPHTERGFKSGEMQHLNGICFETGEGFQHIVRPQR